MRLSIPNRIGVQSFDQRDVSNQLIDVSISVQITEWLPYEQSDLEQFGWRVFYWPLGPEKTLISVFTTGRRHVGVLTSLCYECIVCLRLAHKRVRCPCVRFVQFAPFSLFSKRPPCPP